MNELERLVKLIGTAYSPEQWKAAFPWIHITLSHACNGRAHIGAEVSEHIIEIDLVYLGPGTWKLYKVSIERMEAS